MIDGRSILRRVGRICQSDAVTRIRGNSDILLCGYRPVFGVDRSGGAQRICGIRGICNDEWVLGADGVCNGEWVLGADGICNGEWVRVDGVCSDEWVRGVDGVCWNRRIPIRGSLTLRQVRTRPATIRVYSGAIAIPRLFLAMLGRTNYSVAIS